MHVIDEQSTRMFKHSYYFLKIKNCELFSNKIERQSTYLHWEVEVVVPELVMVVGPLYSSGKNPLEKL